MGHRSNFPRSATIEADAIEPGIRDASTRNGSARDASTLTADTGALAAGWWTLTRGPGPIIATAIHDGCGLRPEARDLMNLSDADRLREEDPFTGRFIGAVPTRVVVHRSRFEVDLNRERSSAVYRTPEQAWGLQVWKQPLDDAFVERSLSLHDHFYDEMRALLAGIEREHGAFVLLDVHSYNHRRDGATAPPTPSAKAPDINIGTFSMPVERWRPVLDALADSIRAFDFRGRRLEVGFNVAFEGRGALTRFVHQNFPQTGCAIAMEVKKFFMDEWTGAPFEEDIDRLRQLIAQLLPVLQSALRRT